jgi:hypothetical protein
MFEFERGRGLSDERGDLFDFIGIHPDVAFGPGAAVAALRALESQAVFVPLLIAHGVIVGRAMMRRNRAAWRLGNVRRPCAAAMNYDV